jgi:hypothetical protein
LRARVLIALLVSTGALANGGCVDASDFQEFKCPPFSPDFEQYVAPLLEQRCGSLDCHGDVARPLRIYGQFGLRLLTLQELANPDLAFANGTFTGGKPTSQAENTATWASVCALEPERSTAVANGEERPDEEGGRGLMFLRKPSGRERHKGGKVIEQPREPYSCVYSWLIGVVNVADCQVALQAP